MDKNMAIDETVTYVVHYKNVKHITLRIDMDGQLEITAPKRTSQRTIAEVVRQKADWIARHQESRRQKALERQQQGLRNCYQDGGQVAYLGQLYPLHVSCAGKRRWQWDGVALQLYGCTEEAHCRQQVEAFYRQQLLEIVLPELNSIVRQRLASLPLPDPSFMVRKMRASWGICYSQDQRIVLNLWLAMAPPVCIQQVLIHEYLHFFESNHGPQFYALLEQFEPQYRQLKHTLSVMIDLRALSQA